MFTCTDEELPKHLSHSAVKTYIDCPAKFYWEKIKYVPAPDPIISIVPFGSAIHAVLEEVFNKQIVGEVLDLKEAKSIFIKEWAKARDEGFSVFKDWDYERLYKKGLEVLEQYYLTHRPNINPEATEVEVVVDINRYPGLRIKGFIDLVDNGGVVDHKVTSGWFTPLRVRIDNQLTIYSVLFRKFFKRKEKFLAFDVVEISKKSVNIRRLTTERSDVQIDEVLAMYNMIWERIKTKTFFKVNDPYKCGGCPYKDLCHPLKR